MQNRRNNTPRRRWTDQDPVLTKALEELRHASTSYQAQVALNIMKVIVEHRAELELSEPSEQTGNQHQTALQDNPVPRRRWYDTDQTLQSALQLLQDTPFELQVTLIPRIAQMVEDALMQHLVSLP